MTNTGNNVEKINTASWSDLRLLEFCWLENGRDIELKFSGPELIKENTITRTVRFCWASGLDLKFEHPPSRGGQLLSIDANARLLKEKQIEFSCDFGMNGFLKLYCNSIEMT